MGKLEDISKNECVNQIVASARVGAGGRGASRGRGMTFEWRPHGDEVAMQRAGGIQVQRPKVGMNLEWWRCDPRASACGPWRVRRREKG